MNGRNSSTEFFLGGRLMDEQIVSKRLKMALEIRNIQQKEFAKKTGLTAVTVSRYVNGGRQPNANNIIVICKTLGISADWLLGLI